VEPDHTGSPRSDVYRRADCGTWQTGRPWQAEAGRLRLYYTPNLPLAVIEAKDNTHGIGAGMQQALGYAETLDVPLTVRVFLWRFERYVAKPCVSLGREPQELQDSLL
jgi:hypothetical protein